MKETYNEKVLSVVQSGFLSLLMNSYLLILSNSFMVVQYAKCAIICTVVSVLVALSLFGALAHVCYQSLMDEQKENEEGQDQD